MAFNYDITIKPLLTILSEFLGKYSKEQLYESSELF